MLKRNKTLISSDSLKSKPSLIRSCSKKLWQRKSATRDYERFYNSTSGERKLICEILKIIYYYIENK